MPFTAWAQTAAATSIFGPGSDGVVILDGVTTYPRFASLAGSTYTLTSDAFPSSLIINAGVTLKPSNFRTLCRGGIINNGTITAVGNAAVGSTAGANQGSAGLIGGRAGGAGGTGVSGSGAAGTNANIGATAGAGGPGTSGAAGAAGTCTVGPINAPANALATPFACLTAIFDYFGNTLGVSTGAGGGGGGSDASSNAGGGGGGGGGPIFMTAYSFVNNGTITAQGGAGAAGTGGNAGGGGGGGGGFIAIYTLVPWSQNGTLNVAGGALGAGVGTGSGGLTGGAGFTLNGIIS